MTCPQESIFPGQGQHRRESGKYQNYSRMTLKREDTHKHQEIRNEQQPLATTAKETHCWIFSFSKSQCSSETKLQGYGTGNTKYRWSCPAEYNVNSVVIKVWDNPPISLLLISITHSTSRTESLSKHS